MTSRVHKDPLKELCRLLDAAGLTLTLDPAASTADPCHCCLQAGPHKRLVKIGSYIVPVGGNLGYGDQVLRPMCDYCA